MTARVLLFRRLHMEEVEKIPVYVDIRNGKTRCLCHRSRKGCRKNCEKDTVTRDKFLDWEKLMQRDRFGKSKI